jgi:hypothetical protein
VLVSQPTGIKNRAARLDQLAPGERNRLASLSFEGVE